MKFASRVFPWPRRGRRVAAVLAGCATVFALAGVSTGTASAAGNLARATGSTAPPPLTVLTPSPLGGNDDDIFLTPTGTTSSTVNGPEIATSAGKVVWFHPLPAGDLATDFRTQTYLGQPVLTWYESGSGGNPETGAGSNPEGVIYNDHFQQIATVKAGNGFTMDEHEFLITPWNTALILADGFTTANLTSIGGPADQTVDVYVVQEIDIKTGKVLFQWNPADYVPYGDSQLPLPPSASDPWDWFHINAVHLDTDGNLLVSSRNTWTVYKVNRHTGDLMWELGGKQSSFTLKAAFGQALDSAGEIFAWQHDPEGLGHGRYTVFDDESGGEYPFSRAVTVDLNLRTHVATLVKSVNEPEGEAAGYAGNAQTTKNGDLFVGWGALPYMSEFSPSGKLLFNIELPSGVFTYRAYLLPWPPRTAGTRQRGRGSGRAAIVTARRLIRREAGDPGRPAVPEVPVTG